MSRILILGAYGFLGQKLSEFLTGLGHTLLLQGRSAKAQFQIQPDNFENLSVLVRKTKPDILINLIANTSVDECEAFPILAFQVNAEIVKKITHAIAGKGIHFIHVSTDQVYGGIGPHREIDTDPKNIYGFSKLLGEYYAQEANATILRTNFVGFSENQESPSFGDWLINALQKKTKITLFDNILFSPVSMKFLCQIINYLGSEKISGVFNIGSIGGRSKASFAIDLAKRLDLNIDQVGIGRYVPPKDGAYRPVDMRLDVGAAVKFFGYKPPTYGETIMEIADEYRKTKI